MYNIVMDRTLSLARETSYWLATPKRMLIRLPTYLPTYLPTQAFQAIHTLYVRYIQSPFSPLTGKILSERFKNGVERQVNLYNQAVAGNAPA